MEALVVFSNENEHWMGCKLSPAFRHVYCVLPTAPQCSTEINLTLAGILTKTFAGDPADMQAEYEALPCTSSTMLVEYDPTQRHLMPYMVNNCVGLTKQLLGLNSWAVTPQQLHRHLILKKGRPMRINLTLAGFGGGSSGKNPLAPAPPVGAAPKTPTPPPMSQSAKAPKVKTPAQMNKQAGAIRNGAENIRNTGGAQGMDISSTTSRALKQLTGQ
tara:strand:- start:16570 stop:17217 length:648 start_codon:yes stop_codon:yes gene_type:complete